MSVEIRLTTQEVSVAAMIGVKRHIVSVKRNLKPRAPMPPTNFNNDILGAIGECAYAKMIGTFWDFSINTFKHRPDVGLIEVRARSLHWYDLIVRESDIDDRFHVLMTLENPLGSILYHGGMLAGEAKQHPEWIKNHADLGEAWFVPQEALTE